MAEKRAAAERLAVAGAANAKLDRAEAKLREVEERAKALRAELAECDEQIVATERALTEARAQRDRDPEADGIEAMAAAIERASRDLTPAPPRWWRRSRKARRRWRRRPGFPPMSTPCAGKCCPRRTDLLGAAVGRGAHPRGQRERGVARRPPEQPPQPEIERQLIYTLNPLIWREGDEVRRVPAFARVGLPKACCPWRCGISMSITSMRGGCRP